MDGFIPNQEQREYCYSCGSLRVTQAVRCSSCGGRDFEVGRARPSVMVEDTHVSFPEPWDLLPWPVPGSVAIHGGPGSGKSSLAMRINPRAWLTKEQEPRPVATMWRRLMGDAPMPTIYMVETVAHVVEVLDVVQRGPLVIDSVSALGMREALQATHAMSEWTKNHEDRALAIVQVNSAGDMAGLKELEHLVDAVVSATPDPWGVRKFAIQKSRWGALSQRYWRFEEGGTIGVPSFNAAYTVEGTPGSYHLHPYPLGGAKWAGLAAFAASRNLLEVGTATAGILAPYLPSFFLEPSDALERRGFAEANGLTWITPEALVERAGPDTIADYISPQRGES